jgi:hypothetical protein
MDEDTSVQKEVPKKGTRASESVPSPMSRVEPSIFSVPGEIGSQAGENEARIYASLGNRSKKIALPTKVGSGREFEKTVREIRLKLTGVVEPSKRESRFSGSMYYLLGMLVGDAHRAFSARHPLEARVSLDLCRAHPENLDLGQFVARCVSSLGVSCGRIADDMPVPNEPHGLYRWLSHFSPVIGWLHTACLGLERDEKTSYDPVRMNWLFTALPEYRVWFLRGMADSDGTGRKK